MAGTSRGKLSFGSLTIELYHVGLTDYIFKVGAVPKEGLVSLDQKEGLVGLVPYKPMTKI